MDKAVVIIPTYNEIENVENIIRAVMNIPTPHFDILIVDDNSPDGTGEAVKKLQNEFRDRLHLLSRSEKNGLGRAYIAGFHWALENGYGYIIEMDADFSHDPADLPRLITACREEGADVAVGSRYVSGVNVVNWPMKRVLMSYFASKYVRLITGIPVNDTTAGFVCYRAGVLRAIDLDSIKFVGYAFQIEMKFKAWKYGFDITEVPIIFTDRTAGTSKMSSGIFVGMPRTMQQTIVRMRPIKVAEPASWTMALMRMDARPVTVMQPAIMPAIAQATPTVIAPFAPASSASKIFLSVRRSSLFKKPTMMAARIDTAAENCMVFAPEETSQTRSTSGASR